MIEPAVVVAIAAAGALLTTVVGGLVAAVARLLRRRRPAPAPVLAAQATAPGTTALAAQATAPGTTVLAAPATAPGATAVTAPASPPGATAAAAPATPPGATADLDVATRMAVALRRRPWARRALSATAVLMVAAAFGLLGYPLFTDVVSGRIQTRLEQQLASPQFRQVYLAGQVEEGDSVTRLRIPAIGVDVVVVEGTSASALRAGAGHYPSTPLPCQAGNVGIAGHRTTYGKPFRDLDRLAAGDEIILDTPAGTCTYRVAQAPFVVAPTDLSVVAPTSDAVLTLTTCHPVGSAAERLVVRADLVPAATTSA